MTIDGKAIYFLIVRYSMEKLLGDERKQMVNSDIVKYVKECDSKNNS